MKHAGNLKNPEVAKAAHVHSTTVSRWRSDGQVPEEDELEAVVALLKKRGVDVTVAWLRYGSSGSAPPVVTVKPPFEQVTYLAPRLLDLARDFVIGIALNGAEPEEIDHVDRTLRSEHVAMLVNQRKDGSGRTPEEQDAEFRLQLHALLRWVVMRIDFLHRKPLSDLAAIEALIGPVPDAPARPESGAPRSPKTRTNRRPPGADEDEGRKRA